MKFNYIIAGLYGQTNQLEAYEYGTQLQYGTKEEAEALLKMITEITADEWHIVIIPDLK